MPYNTMFMQKAIDQAMWRADAHAYQAFAPLRVDAYVTTEPVPFAQRDQGTFHPDLHKGDVWGQLFDCAWFHFTGALPADFPEGEPVLLIDVSAELCLFDEDGVPIQGMTSVHTQSHYQIRHHCKRVVRMPQFRAQAGCIDLWADGGCNDLLGTYTGGTVEEVAVGICLPDMLAAKYDFEVLYELMQILPEESARRASVFHTLYRAARALGTDNDSARAARTLMKTELEKRGGDPSLSLTAIGHAHIDLAWLWPLRETYRKGVRTFATALRMMERYPDYHFGASQPQLYQWVKDQHPALYEQIKRRVAQGRWELQGAMWVEPDANVPSGESFVRQLLYGKRFYQEEFGQNVRTLWLPDVFGYSAALPQILRKAGVDAFLTIKLNYNHHNRFPHHTFRWEGIDGTQVLAHMPPEGNYHSVASPASLFTCEQKYLEKGVVDEALVLFGCGDGGGGAGEEHLERLARMKDLNGLPPTKQGFSQPALDRMREGWNRLPVWHGEIYFERHQGTYTNQARNKWYNRRMEQALGQTELAYVLANIPLPKARLDAIWQEMLLYQFHDILPGSSIARVYEESLTRYQALLEETRVLRDTALHALAARLRLATDGPAWLAFNPLGHERTEWVHVANAWRRLCVPPAGACLFSPFPGSDDAPQGPLVAKPDTLENDALRISFAPNGALVSVTDKLSDREVVPTGQAACMLQVYEDGPQSGTAWDFDELIYDQTPQVLLPLSQTAVTDGPTARLRQTFSFGRSHMVVDFELTDGSPLLVMRFDVHWMEDGKQLRLFMPLDLCADSALCEIQFGAKEAPMHANTTWEMARHEVCAHTWVDVCDGSYGVALLNDSKYGYGVQQGGISLNLLRSSHWPDPASDRARHTFVCALYPHADTALRARVSAHAHGLNQPMVCLPVSSIGNEFAVSSAVHVGHPDIILAAVKPAEDGHGTVLRLYNSGPAHIACPLSFGLPYTEVMLCDLLEQPIDSNEARKAWDEQTGTLTFTGYAIHTLLLR